VSKSYDGRSLGRSRDQRLADQEAYKKEEQRRFEILEAHWDVPLTAVPMPTPGAKP
jgi:hypothetical protein